MLFVASSWNSNYVVVVVVVDANTTNTTTTTNGNYANRKASITNITNTVGRASNFAGVSHFPRTDWMKK